MVELEFEPVDPALVLSSLRHTIDRLELEFARYAAQFAAGTQWWTEGFDFPEDWIRINCHMTSNAALNSVAVGEHEHQLTKSLEAFDEGEIGFAHLATLGRTAEQVGKVFDEDQLLPLAREFSAGKFHFKVQHYKHSLDAKAYNDDQERIAEGRHLSLGTAADGCVLINGVLDPASGAAVRNVLEPLAKPSGEHDDRSREQRLADAFFEAVTRGTRTTLQVTTTVETLLNLAGAAGGEMEFSLPLAASTVQRLACDSSVARVLLDQESLVIDVGRAKPKIHGSLRKALNVRDKHCRWPSCERPAFYCDGHHLQHWVEGGPTDLDNLVLICKRHHRMVHETGWRLVKTSEQRLIAIAPTITFGRPRAPD